VKNKPLFAGFYKTDLSQNMQKKHKKICKNVIYMTSIKNIMNKI